MSRLTASRAAFDLIASFEGFRTRAVQTSDGKWTLGFGHTATAREGLTITRAEADDLLRWDLLAIEDTLRQLALTPLSQNQFDALVSFAFNIGLENFKGSAVLKHLNQGEPIAASLAMHAWRKAYVNGALLTIDALVRRRAAEAALFLETRGPRPAAPTSVVLPLTHESSAPRAHDTKVNPTVVEAPLVVPEEDQVFEDREQQNLEIADAPVSATTPQSSSAQNVPQTSKVVAAESSQSVLIGARDPLDAMVKPAVTVPLVAIEPDIEAQNVPRPAPNVRPSGPVVPQGLTPFPGSQTYVPANGTAQAAETPANDGANTRLYSNPESINGGEPALSIVKQTKASSLDAQSLFLWTLMAVGAGLFAFGMYVTWQAGLLSVSTPKRAPNQDELMGLLAAGGGFIMLMTSAYAAFAQTRDEVNA